MSKKKRKKVTNIDESNVKLFIIKYMKDYNAGLITKSDLEAEILELVAKFPVSEVLEFLPIDFLTFLMEFAFREEEEFQMIAGSFGPEFDFENFVKGQQVTTNKARLKLIKYFEKKKK